MQGYMGGAGWGEGKARRGEEEVEHEPTLESRQNPDMNPIMKKERENAVVWQG